VDLATEVYGGIRVILGSQTELLSKTFIGSHSLPPPLSGSPFLLTPFFGKKKHVKKDMEV
jgi:hypothetical protein